MDDHNLRFEHRSNCELRGLDPKECATHWRRVVHVYDHESHLGMFDVLNCKRCGLGFTDPFPSEDTSYLLYADRVSSDFDHSTNSIIERLKDWSAARLLTSLVPASKVKTVLDYSTGNGRYAHQASKLYPSALVHAVDYPSSPPPLLSSTKSSAVYMSIDSFKTDSRQYDLIILRHVLEHSHHPVEFIKDLAKRLSPEGLLYIEVPNLDSGCARVFGGNWKGYYVPRHIFHFNPSSLEEAVNNAGMRCSIGKNEMPLMGNTISILTGLGIENTLAKVAGVLLHPIQLLIEAAFRSSTCISAKCWRV
jgi:ubiquinone/menaquinone biosynthesis C-methylase UbiE